ncbi:MAG TPA: hypothetical protein VGD50_01245, partial [Candidatus Baltobacteraceae bacterium]
DLDGGVNKTTIGTGSTQTSTTSGGGNGGVVAVNDTGFISTAGTGSSGIFAQSIGGGGGIAGATTSGGTSYAGSAGAAGSGAAVNVTLHGEDVTTGSGADAIFAQSAGGTGTGGAVNVSLTGDALAYGTNADGATTQSLGGAGNGNITVTVNTGSTVQGGLGAGSAGVRFLGGAATTLNNFGLITTALHPIVDPLAVARADLGDAGTTTSNSSPPATSGNSETTQVVGRRMNADAPAEASASVPLATGTRTQVVSHRSVAETGSSDIASLAAGAARGDLQTQVIDRRSVANASATSEAQPSALQTTAMAYGVSSDAPSILFHDAMLTNNTKINLASVMTNSDITQATGTAVYANAGNLTINNYGTIQGSIVLNGATDVLNNHGALATGSSIDLGGTGLMTLSEGGVVSPGGGGWIATTKINGNLNQEAGSDYLVNLDVSHNLGSEFLVSGTAAMNGTIDLYLKDITTAMPGEHSIDIVHASGGVADDGITIAPPKSAVATFALSSDPNDLALNYTVNYAPQGLHENELALGDYFNRIQSAGST